MKSQSGVLDPFATDSNGDPAPLNIPPSFNMNFNLRGKLRSEHLTDSAIPAERHIPSE